MAEQTISWSWVARIWWNVVWRWIIVDLVVTIPIFAYLIWARRTSNVPPWEGQRFFDDLFAVTIWIVLLGWAIGSALRARYGGYRLALISTDGQASVPG